MKITCPCGTVFDPNDCKIDNDTGILFTDMELSPGIEGNNTDTAVTTCPNTKCNLGYQIDITVNIDE